MVRLEEVNKKLKAITVILRASQSIQEVIKKDIASYGLNTTEFAVLELLYHKGAQPIQAIGKKILIASSSITYVVDKLEVKKYVLRRSCPEDRRVTYAEITSDGKILMDEIFPKHEMKMAEIFTSFEDREVDEAIELLKRIGRKAEEL